MVCFWAAVAAGWQSTLPVPGFVRDRPLPLSTEQQAQFEQSMKAADYVAAAELLVKLIEQKPEPPQLHALYTLAGGVLFLDGNYLNSAVAFKKAEKIEPLDESARFTLAMAYVALGQRDWARPELEKLASVNPRTALYPYWLGRLDYDDQKFAAAVEKLNKAISLSPDSAKAHDNLGLSLEALGNYEQASRSYEKAIELNRSQQPPSPWPPLNYGVMLLKLGEHSKAEPYLREALRYNPQHAEGHYRLGLLLEKQGHDAAAIEEQTAAARLDQAYPDPQYALARLYRQIGEPQKAKDALDEFQRRKSRKGRPDPHARARPDPRE
jgi:tetratricopeptide (TPR) repeat protein